MSLMSRRPSFAKASEGEKDNDEPALSVPKFLHQHQEPIEDAITRLPHPRTSDPLNPAVAELMSKAILESGEAYIAAVLNEVERGFTAYEEYYKHVQAWAEGERARVHGRAEDIAAAMKEMRDEREKFRALPRAAELEDKSKEPAADKQPF